MHKGDGAPERETEPVVPGSSLQGMLREIASEGLKRTPVVIEERVSCFKLRVDEVTVLIRKFKSDRVKIVVAPGSLAKSLLSFLFSRKVFESVFAQAIADMREEHADALAGGYVWKARWVVVRDHLNLALTVAAYLGVTVIRKAVGIWRIIP